MCGDGRRAVRRRSRRRGSRPSRGPPDASGASPAGRAIARRCQKLDISEHIRQNKLARSPTRSLTSHICPKTLSWPPGVPIVPPKKTPRLYDSISRRPSQNRSPRPRSRPFRPPGGVARRGAVVVAPGSAGEHLATSATPGGPRGSARSPNRLRSSVERAPTAASGSGHYPGRTASARAGPSRGPSRRAGRAPGATVSARAGRRARASPEVRPSRPSRRGRADAFGSSRETFDPWRSSVGSL